MVQRTSVNPNPYEPKENENLIASLSRYPPSFFPKYSSKIPK